MGEVGNTAIRMSLRSRILLLMMVGYLSLSPKVLAQAATEAAGATSITSYMAASPKPTAMPKGSTANASQSSPHLLASSKAAEVESNRQALEAKAGPEAARLLIRSMPSQAQVWINEKPVGTTPLLLIVPAGKYSRCATAPDSVTGAISNAGPNRNSSDASSAFRSPGKSITSARIGV